jgi:hypothetical protein
LYGLRSTSDELIGNNSRIVYASGEDYERVVRLRLDFLE